MESRGFSKYSFDPMRVIRALNEKDLDKFKNAIDDPLIDINLLDGEDGLSVFERVCKHPHSAEFIEACAKKKNVNSVRI